MTRIRLISRLAIAVIALAIGMVGCAKKTAAPTSDTNSSPKASNVDVSPVIAGALKKNIDVPAEVVGYESAELMSKIDGYVKQVNVNIGDMVEVGQELLILDVPELDDEVTRRKKLLAQMTADQTSTEQGVVLAERQLDEAKALLELNEIKLRRISQLVGKGALNQQKLDEAKFALRSTEASLASLAAGVKAAEAHQVSAGAKLGVAQAELDKAITMAGYRQITAPFAGLITKRSVDPGAFVRPATSRNATPLLSIARIDHVRVIVHLPMDQAGELNVDDVATLHSITALPGKRISGMAISRIARAFDVGSRMMRAELDVNNKAVVKQIGKPLKPGDYGMLTLTLDTYDGNPTVPETALGNNSRGDFVVAVDSKGVSVEVPVTVLVKVDGEAALKVTEKGIQVGDRILTTAPKK